jgi:exonuclease III
MYGDPSHSKTSNIWKEVSTFVDVNIGKPLLCMGDLNELMYPQDKSNMNYVNYSRMHSFRSLVKDCGLFDLGFNGPGYTWCNKRYSSKPLYERLDRFLANAEWSNLFPNANIYNLPILQGDHAPVMAVLHSKFKKPTYHFKFENWWLLE